MPAPIDLTGQQFGRLTAVHRDGHDTSGKTLWLFSCSCGGLVRARSEPVISGRQVSCGCHRAEVGRAHMQALHAAGVQKRPRSPEARAYMSFVRRRRELQRLGSQTSTRQYIDGQPAPL